MTNGKIQMNLLNPNQRNIIDDLSLNDSFGAPIQWMGREICPFVIDFSVPRCLCGYIMILELSTHVTQNFLGAPSFTGANTSA